MNKNVLVTGISGRIGKIVCEFLGTKYQIKGLDLVPAPDFETHIANLSDLESIKIAFENQDVVVHLGADPNGGAPWDSILKNNN